MKQTQTHTWSLAGKEAVAYSLARRKAAAVTRESGEVYSGVLSGVREKATAVSFTWAALRRDGQRENTETVAKQKQLAAFNQPRYHARGVRPKDHVSTNYYYTAPIA